MSSVRELDVHEIAAAVKTMCITANYDLPQDVYDALVAAQQAEESPVGREVLGQLVENADIAAADRVPICQDTGFAVFFAEVGQDVHLVGGLLRGRGERRRARRIRRRLPAQEHHRGAGACPAQHERQHAGHHPHLARAGRQSAHPHDGEGWRRREHEQPQHAEAVARLGGHEPGGRRHRQ